MDPARNAKSRSVFPDQVSCSMRVKRSWDTLSNASAMAEHVVILVKYSKAMRYIQSGSGIESFLPKEILCLFLCSFPRLRNFCQRNITPRESGQTSVWSFITRTPVHPAQETKQMTANPTVRTVRVAGAVSHDLVEWHAIDWRRVQQNVRQLQAPLVKAVQEGRWGQVRA